MVAYSFKKRFVDPVRRGLVSAYPSELGTHPKRQTIRADRRRHARPGEELQLYCGMRTKGCFLIGRARCIAVTPIMLAFGARPIVMLDGLIYPRSLNHLARADGFKDWSEMYEFWRENHGANVFEGVLIQWEPLVWRGTP